jgi:class 3 adenylate cyclase
VDYKLLNTKQFKYLIYFYYGLSIILLTALGALGQPYTIAQPFWLLSLGVIWPFVVGLVLRVRFQSIVVDKSHIFEKPRLQFFMDFGLFVLIGVMVFGYQLFFNQTNILLASKFFFLVLIIGYFASMDTSLVRERMGFESDKPIYRYDFEAGSVTHRLSMFLTITVLIAISATALSAYSYLKLLDIVDWTGEQFMKAFLLDELFIMLLVVSLTLRLIHTHSMNLQKFFDIQLSVLRSVQNGDYQKYVPIVSRDEFGLFARQTNQMIDELKEKEKIQTTLKSVVSPNVMDKLLTKDVSSLKHGKQRNMAILFCDIRQFTKYAEAIPPEEVLLFLNAYFTKMADLVSEHNGVVNKFMGDAILAVYDYEDCESPSEDAFATALDILEHASAVVLSDDRTINIGIGIHYGPAAAGVLGSTDRYEYTYIGDAVNTASRLEGLSKRLKHNVIVSVDAYEQLSNDSRSRLVDLGHHKVRGKNEPVHIYGAAIGDV